ncbi:hypothetical protein D3C71_1947090 [compost metagenome]
MAAVGAGWLDQAMTALPGTQGHGIDTGQAGNLTDRKQVLLHEARIDHRITSLFVHLHELPCVRKLNM